MMTSIYCSFLILLCWGFPRYFKKHFISSQCTSKFINFLKNLRRVFKDWIIWVQLRFTFSFTSLLFLDDIFKLNFCLLYYFTLLSHFNLFICGLLSFQKLIIIFLLPTILPLKITIFLMQTSIQLNISLIDLKS